MSGPPNMAATVDRMGVPVTFRTTVAPTKNADGYQVPGSTSDTPGKMHVYPTPGARREMLPQGMQDGEIWSGGTITVVTAAVEGGARGTEVLWAGKVLEVVQVEHYTGDDGTGGYYEAEMRRVER